MKHCKFYLKIHKYEEHNHFLQEEIKVEIVVFKFKWEEFVYRTPSSSANVGKKSY